MNNKEIRVGREGEGGESERSGVHEEKIEERTGKILHFSLTFL